MDYFTNTMIANAGLRRIGEDTSDGHAYFDRVPLPLLILAPCGRIERINAAARALLGQTHCLSIALGRVTGFHGTASERFESAWAHAQQGRVAYIVVTLRTPEGAQLWHAIFAALDADEEDGERRVIASIVPPVRAERGVLAIARLFGLTCAESRVLAHLTDDRTPSEIAAELGVSLTTVRSHLQAMFQKTGARRQPELVKLALLAAAR